MDVQLNDVLTAMLVVYCVFLNYKINRIHAQVKRRLNNSIERILGEVKKANIKAHTMMGEYAGKTINAHMDEMKIMVDDYFSEMKEEITTAIEKHAKEKNDG